MGWFKRFLGFMDARTAVETKHQQVETIIYEGRVLPDGRVISLDVRNFFVNSLAKELQDAAGWMAEAGLCDDQKAFNVDVWVQKAVSYTSDKARWGLPEFWMLPFETLHVKKGDCEDGAILAANMLLAAGVPAWKFRLNAGEVEGGEGHCWLTYYCEATKRWVALDWCYSPSQKPIPERLGYKDAGTIRRVWFSWTAEKVFFGEAAGWSSGGGYASYRFKYGSGKALVPAREHS